MPSLNQLAAEISHQLGDPFNYSLNERIKMAYKHWYATLVRQSVEKYGIDEQFISNFNVDLIDIDKFDTCITEADCIIKRSRNKIPTPLRYPSDSPFTFVGTLDGTPFTKRNNVEQKYAKHLKWSDKVFSYDYRNGYIYVWNFNGDYLNIQEVPQNPEEAITICTSKDCYDDDMEFPMSEDMITIAKTNILKELAPFKIENEEITNETT